MLLIRVDASKSIGLGHLMRCLTIADYFQLNGIRVLFISKSEYLRKWMLDKRFELLQIPYTASIKEELKIVEQIVFENRIHVMLLDVNNFHSFVSLELYDYYLKQLKTLSLFLISFEDPFNCMHSSDIIIIPYLNSEKLKILRRENTKYLLGVKYYVLRSEFVDIKPTRIRKKIGNILVTMGGCDPQNITLKVINSLKDSNLKLILTIVIGDMFTEIESDINNILKNYKGSYSVVKNVKNIAQIMSDSDLAIINSGLTKYEAISLGLPSIVISNNEYHSELMNDFIEHNVLIHLGTVDKLENNKIEETVDRLAKDFEKRKQMSTSGKFLLDGNGVKRIFSEIPTELLYEI